MELQIANLVFDFRDVILNQIIITNLIVLYTTSCNQLVYQYTLQKNGNISKISTDKTNIAVTLSMIHNKFKTLESFQKKSFMPCQESLGRW